MPHLHGKNGSVKIGATELKGVGSWEVTNSADVADTTGMDSSGHRDIIVGVDSWGGSIDVTYDSGDTPFATLKAGTSFTFAGYLDSGTATLCTGAAIVSSFRMRVDITDKITYAIDFEGTGALTGTGV